ncbi:MAG: AMP-binding protein [Acidimicrobiales bacterium]|nr:AMP-binding protein [Acidimicrobiales bacterium]
MSDDFTTHHSDAVPATFAFADVVEAVIDRVPQRVALVVDDVRWTYAELEDRANRLANHLAALGVGRGDGVALYLDNHPDHAAALLAGFKLAALPLNVNYRYGPVELAAVLADSAPAAILYDRASADTVARAVADLERRPALVAVGAGLDAALAAASPARPVVPRSGDDPYLIYTGGTTGHPKGVVWRQEDAFYACLGGGDLTRLEGPVERPEHLGSRIVGWEFALFPVAPLMHAAAQWQVLGLWMAGAKAVLHRGALDPDAIWRLVERERVTSLVIVGDAIGVPLIEAWEAADGAYDTSSLFSLSSGGAPLSPALRQRIARDFPNLFLINGYGSSETGTQAISRQTGAEITEQGTAGLAPVSEHLRVVDDDGVPVEPGSEVVGRVVAGGRLPLRYHNDPEKTATTFLAIEGRRYLITGDHGRLRADGTIELHGRGSSCINTGGEKVYVEEVEGVLLGNPAVRDAVVVGVPDERWGNAVTAVVVPAAGHEVELEELRAAARETLAGYKLPKHLVLVEEIRRSPAGKADHQWARGVAMAVLGEPADTTGTTTEGAQP